MPYASVHADRSGRVLISSDDRAAAWDGDSTTELTDALPIPDGTELVPLEREAIAIDRSGRARTVGRGRHALAAVLPAGHVRLALPAYSDDPAAKALAPRAYAAVGADPSGALVIAAARVGSMSADPSITGGPPPIRAHPANALARQLARCARDHACRGARSALGPKGDLPVPLGGPLAERPEAPVDLRSGYPGEPKEAVAFHPSPEEIAELAGEHLSSGGERISFGRACDGEPLAAIRVMEAAVALVRTAHPSAVISLETAGSDPTALRRAIDAGVSEVIVRLCSARSDTYARLHGPVAHRWTDVRSCIQLAADRRVTLVIALLAHPGISDRAAEIDATIALLSDLPAGTLEIRDLGSDPARAIAALPRAKPLGMRALLARLAEADHFPIRATGVTIAV